MFDCCTTGDEEAGLRGSWILAEGNWRAGAITRLDCFDGSLNMGSEIPDANRLQHRDDSLSFCGVFNEPHLLFFRITTTVACNMDLTKYPMDKQTCTLQLESCKEHVIFNREDENSAAGGWGWESVGGRDFKWIWSNQRIKHIMSEAHVSAVGAEACIVTLNDRSNLGHSLVKAPKIVLFSWNFSLWNTLEQM